MSIPNPKGYVKPPQDMPPKGGFFFPKYRMSTLMPKGLTTYQIVFLVVGTVIYGHYELVNHSEYSSSRQLVQAAQLFAQRSLFDVFYGPAQTMNETTIDPGKKRFWGMNPMPQLQGRDKRTEAFITSIMTDDKKEQVRKWRHATMDPDVAPYKVCYGPDQYTTPHTCNNYCITPQEVVHMKEIEYLKWKKQQAAL